MDCDFKYDIDFEEYVDKIVNTDDEKDDKIDDKKIISKVIIMENDIYDRDNVNYIYANHTYSNHSKKIYNKGSIYTNKNYFNKYYLNKENNRNDSVKIIKHVSFNDEINKEESPKSVVNLNENSDDVRNKRFEGFIPKGKYVYNKNNFNY